VSLLLVAALALATTSGGVPRFPDIHDDTVVFTAGGDLWRVPATGGTAQRITTHEGEERFARLSPDGSTIAFTAAYEGDPDVWVIPATGGAAQRLTYHSSTSLDDVVWDWTADGERVLFGSRHQAEDWRYLQLYTVGLQGGLPEPVLMSDSGISAFMPDGRLVFNRKFRNFRTWKRYRGGMQQDLWTYDPVSDSSERLTTFPGTDTSPMPHADGSILFVSDRPDTSEDGGPEYSARNLFRRASDGTVTQLTTHTEFDIQWPALHGDRVVYMFAGDLRVYDLQAGTDTELDIVIPDEAMGTRPQREEWDADPWSSSIGPQGKRVAVIAHGNLFTVPVEEGSWRAVRTESDERVTEVAWSPDGNDLAYISDQSGEQQVYLATQSGENDPRILTTLSGKWLDGLTWSLDGDHISVRDQEFRLWDLNVVTRDIREVDVGEYGPAGNAAYSHDGEWLAYLKPEDSGLSALWLYDIRSGENHRITSGFDDDIDLAWDPKGRFLYLVSRRNFDLVTNTFEHRMVHRMTDQIYALRLTEDGEHPVPTRSDEEVEPDGTPDIDPEPVEERRRERRKKRRQTQDVVPDAPRVRIDLEGLAGRLHRLPIEPGRYSNLAATEDGVLFMQSPAIDDGTDGKLMHYSLDDQEVEGIVSGPEGFELAAGGDKLLYIDGYRRVYVTDAQADGGRGDRVTMSDLSAWTAPKQEWARTLDEVRRYLRDTFYDPDMHGHDWDALHSRYQGLLARATDTSDVSWLIGEYISELNVGHAYAWDGWDGLDRVSTGMLGADLVSAPDGVRVDRIFDGEPGRDDRTSPLRAPGVEVEVGDYLLEIDGHELVLGDNPHQWLVGTAGRAIRLTVGPSASGVGSRVVTVEPLSSDRELRYWEGVRQRRAYVYDQTGGRVAYVHVPNTSSRGYTEYVRGLYAQHRMDGMVIDVRYNGGGFIPEMFVEPLLRPHYNTWVPRTGADWRTPGVAVHGPKAMLTNGYAGSGGDAFPYYFRQFELGPLIGETTWGGLVGIEGSLDLLTGGGVTAPSFAFVNRDGEWDVERTGVAPDLPLLNLPDDENAGRDPQLDAAIESVITALETWEDPVPPRPSVYPRRP
jgi:tricorn protease